MLKKTIEIVAVPFLWVALTGASVIACIIHPLIKPFCKKVQATYPYTFPDPLISVGVGEPPKGSREIAKKSGF